MADSFLEPRALVTTALFNTPDTTYGEVTAWADSHVPPSDLVDADEDDIESAQAADGANTSSDLENIVQAYVTYDEDYNPTVVTDVTEQEQGTITGTVYGGTSGGGSTQSLLFTGTIANTDTATIYDSMGPYDLGSYAQYQDSDLYSSTYSWTPEDTDGGPADPGTTVTVSFTLTVVPPTEGGQFYASFTLTSTHLDVTMNEENGLVVTDPFTSTTIMDCPDSTLSWEGGTYTLVSFTDPIGSTETVQYDAQVLSWMDGNANGVQTLTSKPGLSFSFGLTVNQPS